MGAVYRPKYKGADGTVRQSAVWWIRYRQHGKTLRQSTETTDRAKALRSSNGSRGKVALNIPIILAGDRLTLDAAAELIRRDYAINERRSAKSMGHALVNVLARLGGTTRLARVTTAQVEAYKSARLVAGAKPATVNRELAALSRMASLAKHQHGLAVTFTNGPAP